ncbi:hypothetical protein BOTBODRAFT_31743 [Botryobasidium botryosum FD-172 SS1]|uniref:ubiquitinyl hydrolase 1 n=1 Tax=Botryobasidium botryosum (strain FD-172 SS1) TaxID=930990 RepID=A0A067MIR8_BOTB1|nr:hypothetical protein BOTBODRAFT_31743 [Botryobasidium botryosum FD-172 SS1]
MLEQLKHSYYDFLYRTQGNPQEQFAIAFLLLLSFFYFVPPALQSLLETLGMDFLWSWVFSDSSASHSKGHKKNGSNGGIIRSRAQQLAFENSSQEREDDGYVYPGLVNVSGTYCFMNSTVQALASLSYLQPRIEAVHEKAEKWDVPTPVTDQLRDLLTDLNTPQSHRSSIRPVPLINALSAPRPGTGSRSLLFSSREHQDAQELFQLLSSLIKDEAVEVAKESKRDRGLIVYESEEEDGNDDAGKSPFEGLTANRRSCVECGYTEAVMHFAFDNIQLPVPRMASCLLEECLAEYTRLETLTDCICRKCSLLATHHRLKAERDRLSASVARGSASSSKKKRAREARKYEERVHTALDQGRIEDDIRGVTIDKVVSRCSTKQAMIARPPPILALHLNRSMYHGYAGKNPCRVVFPEYLDLTPFTTSGRLSTSPSAPISSPSSDHPRSTTPTPASLSAPRILYRLSAVVCHYGMHSFGHYIAYRRKPRAPTAGNHRFDPPVLRCPLGCECEKCVMLGPVREEDEERPKMGGWLKISDDRVEEVGINTVLAENSGTFMLYYERVVGNPLAFPAPESASQETLTMPVEAPAVEESEAELKKVARGARVVRSVSTRRLRAVAAAQEGTKSNGHAIGNGAPALANGSASGGPSKIPSPPKPHQESTAPERTDPPLAPLSSVPLTPVRAVRQSDGLPDSLSSPSSPPPTTKANGTSSPSKHSARTSHSRARSPPPNHPASLTRPMSPQRTVGLRA